MRVESRLKEMAVVYVIFDFDGTIAASGPAIVEAFNELSGRYGHQRIASEEQAMALRDVPMSLLLKRQGVPFYKVPRLVRAVRARLGEQITRIPVYEGVPEALQKLALSGARIGVLSSNSSENIRAFLAHCHLSSVELIFGDSSLFGKGRSLRQLVRSLGVAPANVYYVGDEVRDVAAARKAGVHAVAVTWGFNSKELLSTSHPDVLCERPSQLADPKILSLRPYSV